MDDRETPERNGDKNRGVGCWLPRLLLPPLMLPAAVLMTRLLLFKSYWGEFPAYMVVVPVGMTLMVFSAIASLVLSTRYLVALMETDFAERSKALRTATVLLWASIAFTIAISGTQIIHRP